MRVSPALCVSLLVFSGTSVGAQGQIDRQQELQAADRLALRASPEISYAPARLFVRATIAADDDNRAMEIVIDSLDFYRSSTVQLEGSDAPRVSVFEFEGVPSGTYVVSARLLDQQGEQIASARRQVSVVSSGP
jgi:hypothetical protein